MADTVILIVDDDRTMARLCKRLLERSAFQAITALDPFDALYIIENQKIDLLLTDIRMPGIDGFELIRKARQFQPDLPAMLMTGYGGIDVAIQALRRGVDGLILKPFSSTTELTEAVQGTLEDSRQKRDAARLHVLRPLFDVTERLLAETTPHVLEALIIDSMLHLSQSTCAAICWLADSDRPLEVLRMTTSEPSPDLERLQKLVILAAPETEAVIDNISSSEVNQEIQTCLRDLGWDSLLLARVQHEGSNLVFCASRSLVKTGYTEADRDMFVILARQAAVAIENSRLYSEMEEYVRQLELSQRALVQAEKMAAVGRLMASMAHEINNPLQSVRNSLHLANRMDVPPKQRKQFIDLANTQLERLVKTVRDMLDFYRPSGQEWEAIDIRDLITQVLQLLGPALKEHAVKLSLDCQVKNPKVLGSADQLQQVILNILINAMDSLAEETKQPAEEKEIWIDVYQLDQHLYIHFEDSGPGVPPEMQERIFEPFVSTKKNGTGLGLAVSYGIMERHRGNLSLVPAHYRQGACFQMILPVGVVENDG